MHSEHVFKTKFKENIDPLELNNQVPPPFFLETFYNWLDLVPRSGQGTDQAPFRGGVGSSHPSGKCMSMVCLEPKDIYKLLNGRFSREIATNKAAFNLQQRHCKAPAVNNKKRFKRNCCFGFSRYSINFCFQSRLLWKNEGTFKRNSEIDR